MPAATKADMTRPLELAGEGAGSGDETAAPLCKGRRQLGSAGRPDLTVRVYGQEHDGVNTVGHEHVHTVQQSAISNLSTRVPAKRLIANITQSYGSSRRTRDRNVYTVLCCACREGHTDATAPCYVAIGVRPSTRLPPMGAPRCILHAACLRGQTDCTRLLCEQGAAIDQAEGDEAMSLYAACPEGQIDCAAWCRSVCATWCCQPPQAASECRQAEASAVATTVSYPRVRDS